MTRTELDLLYKAKTDVERMRDLAAASESWTINATKIKEGLDRALWKMKQLVDSAVIEHTAENNYHSREEAKATGSAADDKRSV